MQIAHPRVRRVAIAASLAILATSAAVGTRALDARSNEPTTNVPANKWLDGLKGKHRQFFDAPAPNGGIPLVHIMNFYNTLNKAYNVKDADIDAVLTFYGATTFYALNDAAWAKYRLGEFLDTRDVNGQFASANPWRSAPYTLGMTLAPASIESLQKRGATFIVCNNALTFFAGVVAAKRGLDAAAVFEDMKANILPGVELIPGMVVAVEQAARAGLSYHRQ
jgi:hypothetical protein